MAIDYTPEQKKAIETLDKSVLVSAAAGSGKTAILVERILRIILEGKANVDELLVVTFTKAAASEMKLRLASAIRRRMREEPGDAKRLRDQLSRLYRAYITTIDSFALRVIREFFYMTDNEPDFRACDEIQGELMRREALSELFDECFEDDHYLDISEDDERSGIRDAVNSVGFREFLRLYSEERQEDTFKDRLLKSYTGLRSIPDYFEWAYAKAEELRVTDETFGGSALQDAMMRDAQDTFARACGAAARVRKLLEEAGLEDLFESKLLPEYTVMHEMLGEARSGRFDKDTPDRAGAIAFASFRAGKDHKEAYEPIKDEIKALRDIYKKEFRNFALRYASPDLETRLSEMRETYRYTVYYIRLLEVFERRYNEKKKERRVLDFSDMEHTAVRILRDEETAGVMRKRFRYIFVDEYQDTNRIQEELISSVAKPDNVFRVGDIKQSIYKFRQAEPEIFREVYDRFSEEDNEDGEAIDLGKNFRSNDATIRYINRVFSEIMDGYDERAMLYTGTDCPPEYDFIPEVHILTDADIKEADGGGEEQSPDGISAGDGDMDGEILSLSKEEAEADYIAGIVADLIGTEFEDTKTKEVRKAEAKDIVILFRAVKARGEIMSAALRRHAIEPHIEESDDYFDTVEISIAMSLLSCIDNMKRDVPLISALHSAVFGWSASELAKVRIAHTQHMRQARAADADRQYHRAPYWETFRWYCDEGPDGELKDKAALAMDRLLGWRRDSHMMPLGDFVWHVLIDSGCYRMAGAMHGGARRQNNLRALADRAEKYSRETVASLSSYIRFVDVMRQKGIKSAQTPAAAGDEVVRISTIHKSRGLEYPFVIVGGLGHRFRPASNEKGLSFDSSLGIGLPYIDPSRKYWRSTLMQRAINAKAAKDSYDEELRILYVAMTRARNKLILVGTCNSEAKLAEYTAKPDCYLKVMRDVLKTGANTYRVSPLGDSSAGRKYSHAKIPDPADIVLTPAEEELYAEIDRRFAYEYPHMDLLSAKAKYSVSELRRKALEGEQWRPAYRADRKSSKVSAADIGTAYHRIMEFADFGRACGSDGTVDEAYIRECADRLAESGAISGEVFSEIDTDRVAGFFRTDIGRRAADAARRGALKKEKAFTLRTQGSEGGDILVQGVIDCCFEEDGRMVLIDYKSSYIRPGDGYEDELERIRREYAVQIDLYSEAVTKGTGLEVGEAYLYLFSSGEALGMNSNINMEG